MAYAAIREVPPILKEDRVLSDGIEKIRQMIREGIIPKKLTA